MHPTDVMLATRRHVEVERIRRRLEEGRRGGDTLPHVDVSSLEETDSRRAEDHGGDLSYQVYKLADLEARRATLASMPPPTVLPSPRETIKRATIDSMQVAIAWSRGSRCEGLVDTMRPPLTTLLHELRRLNGKAIALRVAIAVTSIVVFVGATLFLADITDDVHPVRASATGALLRPATHATPVEAPKPLPVVEAARPLAVVVETVVNEAPRATTKATAGTRAKSKRDSEIFLP